jgi:hypothetical protein
MGRPVYHQTDIFHPHADPDDHWDLACNYALAVRGDIDLLGVMIDYPPWMGDPAVAAIAQMNFITGLAVPIVVGAPQPMVSRTDAQSGVEPALHGAANELIRALRRSSVPVVINIVGSCRDVALAGLKEPELFKEKCAAIYLNAGTGSPKPEKAAELEYNVQRNPASYAAIFDLSCPVYWMPCWDEAAYTVADRKVMEWGTHWRFRQSDILDRLSPVMQNYFIYALERSADQNWLRYLLHPVDPALLKKCGELERSMWSTAAFFHSAGYSVDRDGNIIPLAGAGGKAVYAFEPVTVTCEDGGLTEWKLDPSSKNRFKFRVLDLARYQAAMTRAMGTLLGGLSITVPREEAKMDVPVEVYRGLYVRGSLKNTVDGFRFTLKNNILESIVTAVGAGSVDGTPYDVGQVTVESGGAPRPCTDISAGNPFLLALDAEATFAVRAKKLQPGAHRLVISFTAELVGKVEFDITDNTA